MIATTLLLDSRLAMWTRFRGALYLCYASGRVGIVIAKLIEFVASKPLVPLALVSVAVFESTEFASDLVVAADFVKLTMAATYTWTPYPVLSRLFPNL